MKHRAYLDWYYLGLTVAMSALGAAYLWDVDNLLDLRANQSLFRWALFSVGIGAALGEVLSASRNSYLVAASVHFVATILLLPLVAAHDFTAIAVLTLPLIGAVLHNPHPVGAIVAVGYSALTAAFFGIALRTAGAPAARIALSLVCYVTVCSAAALFAGGLVHHRESLIASRAEARRLDQIVDRLSRANIEYQEYAKTIQEESTELERKRITRDIHDIVGYTLTNNITMMEAIIDMMRVNPLGVGALVRSARENAEEGLTRIRESLHLLREREVALPTGFAAVRRLIQVFERGTGVKVEFHDPMTVGWRFGGETDVALYHVVQESLMNAFRHGKASRVLITIGADRLDFRLSVRDNGVGTMNGIVEGIGLKGMRERLEKIGGVLSAASLPDGFAVVVTVPKQQFPEVAGA